MCGLIMLLPHGYEGQGQSAHLHLERYLQLCATAYRSLLCLHTGTQVYHMLRRQALHVVCVLLASLCHLYITVTSSISGIELR